MTNDLIAMAAVLWLAAAMIALLGRRLAIGRWLAALGCIAGMIGAVLALPHNSAAISLPFLRIGDDGTGFALSPAALWLFGFGLAPAMAAALLGSPGRGARFWVFGLSMSLLGGWCSDRLR